MSILKVTCGPWSWYTSKQVLGLQSPFFQDPCPILDDPDGWIVQDEHYDQRVIYQVLDWICYPPTPARLDEILSYDSVGFTADFPEILRGVHQYSFYIGIGFANHIGAAHSIAVGNNDNQMTIGAGRISMGPPAKFLELQVQGKQKPLLSSQQWSDLFVLLWRWDLRALERQVKRWFYNHAWTDITILNIVHVEHALGKIDDPLFFETLYQICVLRDMKSTKIDLCKDKVVFSRQSPEDTSTEVLISSDTWVRIELAFWRRVFSDGLHHLDRDAIYRAFPWPPRPSIVPFQPLSGAVNTTGIEPSALEEVD